MHVLVAYDITDDHLRGKIFSFLKEKGVHSQRSVFECETDPESLRNLLRFLKKYDLGERDSIVLYPLCRRCARKVRVMGQGCTLAERDWMII